MSGKTSLFFDVEDEVKPIVEDYTGLTLQDIKRILKNDFDTAAAMTVEKYTLYSKWLELNKEEWNAKKLAKVYEVKDDIWQPTDYNDYLKLKPVVIPATTGNDLAIWTSLRMFIHTMKWVQSVGRNLKFYVMDKVTKKYLGVISLGSDFISLGGRDRYIGWTMDNRLKDKMLNHTAMGSSIVPTQPLGYNYLGGKLIALMVLSDVVENEWNKRYKENLVALTTTSLYGGYSQYNRLKYWRKCESTEGQIPLEPTEQGYRAARSWMKENFPKELREIEKKKEDGSIPSHPKIKTLEFVYKRAKVRPPVNNFPRGVYFSELFENTNAFLRKETDNPGKKAFDNSVEALSELWKERYAKNRIENILKDGRYKPEILFYDAMVGMSWEEAKEKYLDDVGR